jgi:hypothetical protein
MRSLLVAFTFVLSVFAAGSIARAYDCESAFVASEVDARWRSAATDQYVIDQTDRLLRAEYNGRLPSEIYQSVRVDDFSRLRFEAQRVSLVELTPKGNKSPVGQFRIFSAGETGRSPEVLPFFEIIHKEASASREWRRMSSVTMIHFGFSSTLSSWQVLYGPSNVARRVFELSRLAGPSEYSLSLRREFEKHQELNPNSLYFAYAKTSERVEQYSAVFGLRIVESFKNPRTGSQEFILSNLNSIVAK